MNPLTPLYHRFEGMVIVRTVLLFFFDQFLAAGCCLGHCGHGRRNYSLNESLLKPFKNKTLTFYKDQPR
jgi:hypothetical protein